MRCRDTDNANGSIGPIFDKEKEQNRLKQVQPIGEIVYKRIFELLKEKGRLLAH
ncbi:hypothetical protein [Serratia liquefaciens]|uniref:hypothetical protein n=1 Tax=Serratia liquefaciens TaxID=614 RepID=UPI0021CA06A6|nr:hypothetical protein [Serratia liquefaciens]